MRRRVSNDQELYDLAEAIEAAEGLDPLAALTKAKLTIAEMKRRAHQWDDQAFRAGNPTAIEPKRN